MNSKAGVAAVDRAFDILHAFTREKPVLTLAEIARATGLYKSTILRLMGSLEKYGFVWQRADGSYQLGSGLLALSAIFQDSFELRDYVQPVLEELVAATNEGASFFIRDDEYQVCLFRIDGRHAIRDYSIRLGDRRVLNEGAASTILRRFETPSAQPVRPEDFCVVSVGRVDPEMAAMSMPVFGAGHALLGTISLSGPSLRFTPDYVEKLRPLLREACVRLSINLGETPARFALLHDD
ncbi:transcriptional regulator [Sphingobium jiangsuense]|uniref:DNA-binding IclR family transcriptional regulator n=1 Tax=Sphingobium jiangsuense TaxID=870476 RepID=A0A7W6BK95_9SPHN|nr:IclR family transcriptional regulator [Sphingobium jiangsuense]MBB3926541.1 DNA-binding IclR family transcriptional regulator [Sphingobium jiangsuense]GLT01434.1 transcriptional regulator [Sphingobium jiangsuense]